MATGFQFWTAASHFVDSGFPYLAVAMVRWPRANGDRHVSLAPYKRHAARVYHRLSTTGSLVLAEPTGLLFAPIDTVRLTVVSSSSSAA